MTVGIRDVSKLVCLGSVDSLTWLYFAFHMFASVPYASDDSDSKAPYMYEPSFKAESRSALQVYNLWSTSSHAEAPFTEADSDIDTRGARLVPLPVMYKPPLTWNNYRWCPSHDTALIFTQVWSAPAYARARNASKFSYAMHVSIARIQCHGR